MKNVAVFGTKSYDWELFDSENNDGYDIRYFKTRLTFVRTPH